MAKSTKKHVTDIDPNQSVELLKALHILTRDGQLNQDSRRKLKQVYHLFRFIEPMLKTLEEKEQPYRIVDHGAGKSYLGFILYDLFIKHHLHGHIDGIETRAELVASSQALAHDAGFERMGFHHLTVQDAINSNALPQTVEMVTALHACDTATDDAIAFALSKQAEYVVLVPCCQAEVASILRAKKNETFGKTALSEIWRHPIHTREFGSQITNVLRCLQLESHGYQVTVTELVGWEHAMKNELIIAKKTGQAKHSAKQRMATILNELNLTDLNHRFIDK